jgi:hypothetical protein
LNFLSIIVVVIGRHPVEKVGEGGCRSRIPIFGPHVDGTVSAVVDGKNKKLLASQFSSVPCEAEFWCSKTSDKIFEKEEKSND